MSRYSKSTRLLLYPRGELLSPWAPSNEREQWLPQYEMKESYNEKAVSSVEIKSQYLWRTSPVSSDQSGKYPEQ